MKTNIIVYEGFLFSDSMPNKRQFNPNNDKIIVNNIKLIVIFLYMLCVIKKKASTVEIKANTRYIVLNISLAVPLLFQQTEANMYKNTLDTRNIFSMLFILQLPIS
jgi:hypothetical protein